MNEELIPEFAEAVDVLSQELVDCFKQNYKPEGYSVENIMLNVFTACIFKTVAKNLKKDQVERFCEQIKTNLKVNFEALEN